MSPKWLLLHSLFFLTVFAKDKYHPNIIDKKHHGVKLGAAEIESKFWQDKARQTIMEKLQMKLNKNEAQGVILFLGDGMSVPTLAATRSYLKDESVFLEFETFPFTGLSRTYALDHKVPDSACTATAYLGGVKGNSGTIGVNGYVDRGNCIAMRNASNHVHSIAQLFQDKGYATGIVTTTRVTHASPAGAYSHVADRDWESDLDVINHQQDPKLCDDIARQLIHNEPGTGFNVIMGGGRDKFQTKDQGGQREDGEDLINTWKLGKQALNESYAYVSNRSQLIDLMEKNALPQHILGLFNGDHINDHWRNATEEPTLEEMTEAAIKILQATKKKFFLFVEGGKIDLAHHGNQAHAALDETVEFSKAVAVGKRLTDPSDTLLIITADHAHTMSFSGYADREDDIFGSAGTGSDNKPYLSLSYANGPGFKLIENGRPNYDDDDKQRFDYAFPATAPLSSETHGGDDVAIFASGPWAHLLTGSIEENVIHHAMAFAACVGDGPTACNQNNTDREI